MRVPAAEKQRDFVCNFKFKINSSRKRILDLDHKREFIRKIIELPFGLRMDFNLMTGQPAKKIRPYLIRAFTRRQIGKPIDRFHFKKLSAHTVYQKHHHRVHP